MERSSTTKSLWLSFMTAAAVLSAVLFINISGSNVRALTPTFEPTALALSPASQTVGNGGAVQVRLELDSPNMNAPAVQAVITYSESLTFVQLDHEGSIFPQEIQVVEDTANRTITIVRSVFDEGFKGENGLISTLHFTASSGGESTIAIDQARSEVISYDTLENILERTENATITVQQLDSICLQVALDNRGRRGNGSALSVAHVEIKNPSTGEKLFQTQSPLSQNGRITLTGLDFLNGDEFEVTVKPRGYLKQSIVQTGTVLAAEGTCTDLGEALSGDLDADNDIDIADLVLAIRHYNKNDNEVLTEIYPDGLQLTDLVGLIKNFIRNRAA